MDKKAIVKTGLVAGVGITLTEVLTDGWMNRVIGYSITAAAAAVIALDHQQKNALIGHAVNALKAAENFVRAKQQVEIVDARGTGEVA